MAAWVLGWLFFSMHWVQILVVGLDSQSTPAWKCCMPPSIDLSAFTWLALLQESVLNGTVLGVVEMCKNISQVCTFYQYILYQILNFIGAITQNGHQNQNKWTAHSKKIVAASVLASTFPKKIWNRCFSQQWLGACVKWFCVCETNPSICPHWAVFSAFLNPQVGCWQPPWNSSRFVPSSRSMNPNACNNCTTWNKQYPLHHMNAVQLPPAR